MVVASGAAFAAAVMVAGAAAVMVEVETPSAPLCSARAVVPARSEPTRPNRTHARALRELVAGLPRVDHGKVTRYKRQGRL